MASRSEGVSADRTADLRLTSSECALAKLRIISAILWQSRLVVRPKVWAQVGHFPSIRVSSHYLKELIDERATQVLALLLYVKK